MSPLIFFVSSTFWPVMPTKIADYGERTDGRRKKRDDKDNVRTSLSPISSPSDRLRRSFGFPALSSSVRLRQSSSSFSSCVRFPRGPQFLVGETSRLSVKHQRANVAMYSIQKSMHQRLGEIKQRLMIGLLSDFAYGAVIYVM